MNFQEILERRQSCRSFDFEKKIEDQKLQRVLDAARLAPSACNAQPYELFVAQGAVAEAVAKTRAIGMNKFMEQCNTFIILSEDSYNLLAKIGAQIQSKHYKSIDIGIAAAHIVLAAAAEGLETCIIGTFSEKKLQEILHTHNKITLIIAIGYGSEQNILREKQRKPFNELIKYLR